MSAIVNIPKKWADQGLGIRPISDYDYPFILKLYTALRWPEVGPLIDWTHQKKIDFLADQCRIQHDQFVHRYPNTDLGLLELRGEPIGRFYCYRRFDAYHIVDIGLMPEMRGKGLGTALIMAFHEEASMMGRPVTLYVERFNPAQRLYARLGFEMVPGSATADGVYYKIMLHPKAHDYAKAQSILPQAAHTGKPGFIFTDPT